MTKIYVEGYIELNDSRRSRVKFNCSTEEGFWNQWGNTTEALCKTVDITSKIQEAINDSSIVYDLQIGETS
jgi:hypothetical protein